jgi:hypothetical protein
MAMGRLPRDACLSRQAPGLDAGLAGQEQIYDFPDPLSTKSHS